MKYQTIELIAPKEVRIRNEELPLIKGDNVLVSVVSCGVCTSELPVWRGECFGARGISFRYNGFPCFLGHEVAGIVAEVGRGVKNLKVGDRVTGVAYSQSGFATHVIEPENCWVQAPDKIPLEQVLGEPLMAVVNIVRMCQPDLGDFIFLVGDGFMSLLTIAALARYPLKALVVVGHHDRRLALAKEFGSTHTINTKREDAYWQVRRLVDGKAHDAKVSLWGSGVDIAFDFAGKMSSLQLCASLCKPKQRAKLMMPSFYTQESFTIGHYLMNRAPSLIVCHPAHSKDIRDDLRRAMWALEEGIFPMGRLISHVFSLDQVNQAMEMAMNRTNGYIKGIVVPDFSKLESEKCYSMKGGEIYDAKG